MRRALLGAPHALSLLSRLFRDRRVCVIAPLQPLDRMSVEEGPGGDHDEKGHCCACEAEVHSKFDVLQEEAHDEGEESGNRQENRCQKLGQFLSFKINLTLRNIPQLVKSLFGHVGQGS